MRSPLVLLSSCLNRHSNLIGDSHSTGQTLHRVQSVHSLLSTALCGECKTCDRSDQIECNYHLLSAHYFHSDASDKLAFLMTTCHSELIWDPSLLQSQDLSIMSSCYILCIWNWKGFYCCLFVFVLCCVFETHPWE